MLGLFSTWWTPYLACAWPYEVFQQHSVAAPQDSSWSLSSNQRTRSSYAMEVRVITEEGTTSLLRCFLPTLKTLQFWISGGECILNAYIEIYSNLILTCFSSHDRLPEHKLFRERQPGSALYRGVRDKSDGPVIWAVWWICLVTQCAPCREGKRQQELKRCNSPHSANGSQTTCFSSAPTKGCFYLVYLICFTTFTQKNMKHVVTVR